MAKRRKAQGLSRRVPAQDTGFAEETKPQEAVAAECALLAENQRQVERDLQRELLALPHMRFSSLVVRRVRDGVFCLEGVLETSGSPPDVCGLAQRVAGVQEVLNHLVVQHPRQQERAVWPK